MRKSFWIIAILFAAIVAPKAHADTFSFSATAIAVGTASGLLTTDPISGGTYLVEGITGTSFDGQAITGLAPTNTIGSNDNLLYPTTPFLDTTGVAYFTASGTVFIRFNGLTPGSVITGSTYDTTGTHLVTVGSLTPITPEIDPASGTSALALLAGVTLVIRGHREKVRKSESV
jgi:hypothetical protein